MTATSLSPETVNYVCTLVRQRSAIELEASKSYLIEARLTPVAARNGYGSACEMVRALQTNPKPGVQQQLVEAMTTNETSFFRDAHPFEALRTTILPELLRYKSSERTLNLWSAACSTGQEAYSMAMLMAENFPSLDSWQVQVLGTDLSDDVLNRARAASFSQIEINRGLPAALLAKYFRREGMQWRLEGKLQALTKFVKLNLIESWPAMPRMDVVFLRNVLIYFSPETKRTILQKVRSIMAPHAVLFLGGAETTMGLDNSFERTQVGSSVFYRLK
jgi:chemotaxis protein methyltransferase CheR